MSNLLPLAVAVPFFGLCLLLPAQEGTPKPQEPAKVKNPAASPADPQKDADAKDPTRLDAAIKAIDKFIAESKIDTKAAGWKTRLPQPPKVEFDANTDYFWHLETEVGAMKIRYYPDASPVHVTSGIYLARLGFYDGLGFHRIITGFMAQGGCPEGNGKGSPGYKFPGEFAGKYKHSKPGILSMANAGPGTDGSQFFITFAPQDRLDAGYTVWGEVVEGLETLKPLEAKANPDPRANGMLATPVKITKTWISVAPKAKPATPAEKPAEKPKDGDKK